MLNTDRHFKESTFRKAQSLVIATILSVLPCVFGYLLAGQFGLLIGLLAAFLVECVVPSLPPSLVFRSLNARPLSYREHPLLHQVLANYSASAELAKVPELYIIPSQRLNAIAVGNSESSAIGLTLGLLRFLPAKELCGVVGHELGHIKHNDTGLMRLAQWSSQVTLHMFLLVVLTGLLMLPAMAVDLSPGALIALFCGLAILPGATALLVAALSRSREYDADLFSARITGNPYYLASALFRMDQLTNRSMWRRFRPGAPAQAAWLSSHPDTENRIERLKAVTRSQPLRPSFSPQREIVRPQVQVPTLRFPGRAF